MAGLGLMNRRRAIQSSPTQFTLAMNDNLIAMYDMSGKSNDDADRNVVADQSGKGNNISFNIAFDSTYGYHDGRLVSRDSYDIYLSETLGDEFTIIIDRVFAEDITNYSALIGARALEDSNKSAFCGEYRDSGNVYLNTYRGGHIYEGRINSPIFFMTPNCYNGFVNNNLVTTTNYTTNRLTIGRVRTGAGYPQTTRIRCIYIFNKTFSPNDIERYIQENIMPDYVLPIV